MVNNAVELKLRAERGAGKKLIEMKESGERDTGKGGDRKSQSQAVTLRDLGIERMQSSRWQQEAEVPDDEFEAYIERTKAAKEELSSEGVLRLIRQDAKDKEIATAHQANEDQREDKPLPPPIYQSTWDTWLTVQPPLQPTAF